MAARPEGKNGRALVPVEIASFLHAPFGWTIRTRRDEGHPVRGERQPASLGFGTSLAMALAAYGPVIVGAFLGWRSWGGGGGAGLGALLGLTVQVVVFMAALPVLLFVRSRTSR